MTPIVEFATREALMQAVAARIVRGLNEAIAERGEACAALSGGGTPEPAYRLLSGLALDWPKITFLLVDERFVPPTDPASNEALLRRTLAPALAAGAHLLPMFAADSTPEEAARRADAAYRTQSIDFALMGMGEDGHTASWFPGMPALRDALDPANPRTVIAIHAPEAASSCDRLTLTRAAIGRTRAVLLLITGDAKRARLSAKADDAPVMALFEPPASIAEVWWAP